jgi:hypothetical protein
MPGPLQTARQGQPLEAGCCGDERLGLLEVGLELSFAARANR